MVTAEVLQLRAGWGPEKGGVVADEELDVTDGRCGLDVGFPIVHEGGHGAVAPGEMGARAGRGWAWDGEISKMRASVVITATRRTRLPTLWSQENGNEE